MLLENCRKYTAKRLCPICYGAVNYRLFDLHYDLFDDSPLSEIMHVSACCQCGFVYYDTSTSEIDYNEFYAHHYFIHAYNSENSDYQSNQNYLKGIINFLLDGGVRKDAHIADLGCGQGQLLRALSQEGFVNLTGVELCVEYSEQLIRDGIDARTGSALDTFEAHQKKDVLIYKHIFEHFYDISSATRIAAENLKSGGFLFIAVPDACRYNEFYKYSFLHYLTIEHINHFDLKHIQILFQKFGFSLVNHESRMLDIAEDFQFPILTCLLRKNRSDRENFLLGDFALANKMFNWFKESQDLNTLALQELKECKGLIYVWGLSYRTMMYLSMSELKNCRIEAYVDIDQRKQNKFINGKKVVSPDILKNCTEQDTIVIGVGPSSVKMEHLILEKGFLGEIIRLM